MTELKKPQISSCWPFQIDRVESFAYWNNAFTPEECDKIIEIGNSYEMRSGKVATREKSNTGTQNYEPNSTIRDSEVVFLQPSAEMVWVYQRLTDLVLQLNRDYFNFDIFSFGEGLQFTKYVAPAGKYNYHVDAMHGCVVRKLSIVLQLSDPETYVGGDFCIKESREEQKLKRDRGTLIIFPSYKLHAVAPVTEGTRYSLVGWINGPQFK